MSRHDFRATTSAVKQFRERVNADLPEDECDRLISAAAEDGIIVGKGHDNQAEVIYAPILPYGWGLLRTKSWDRPGYVVVSLVALDDYTLRLLDALSPLLRLIDDMSCGEYTPDELHTPGEFFPDR